MKKKRLTLLFALLVFALPALAVFDGNNLGATLMNLRYELQRDFLQISQTQEKLTSKYEAQHQQMVDIIKECNELSLMLYSQRQDFTFDLTYALEKVTREYNEFNKDRMPYDRIVKSLDIEIDRYARLIESLRRLPPELKEVAVVPDSLAYHNDTLEMHLMQNDGALNKDLEAELIAYLEKMDTDTTALDGEDPSPFLLDENGERDRDSCLFYAGELLKLYADSKAIVVADSIHYREAYLRLKESYDYAKENYDLLQNSIFVEGQTPWLKILKNPLPYWRSALEDTKLKFDFKYVQEVTEGHTEEGDVEHLIQNNQVERYLTLLIVGLFFVLFFALWGIFYLIIYLLTRFVKPLKNKISREQRNYIALLVGCLAFVGISTGTTSDNMTGKAISLTITFIWLLSAIVTALLIRLRSTQLKKGVKMYLPTIIAAAFVIGFRVLFLPNNLMNFIFPPFLLIMVIWQLISCLHLGKEADKYDVAIGWISMVVNTAAFITAAAGYIFIALLILVWWYFQLAAILSIVSLWFILDVYKERRLAKRITEYRKSITFVTGHEREQLMFGVTWLYDLLKTVFFPLVSMMSFPLSLHMALNVFDFDDLYKWIFNNPFVLLVDNNGFETLRISLASIILLFCLFFIFKYLNKAFHTIWRTTRYHSFMTKNNRKIVRSNEINLSLGDSIISVLTWMIYITIVILILKIPTGSLSIIAGGLSAGIGLAMKDILNNFIYGIQLMSGRLRVGDWIECDGVRGKVVDINYQSTLVETEQNTSISFLNASLFAKNFTNLTKSDSYELIKIMVGVAYGTDVIKVRDVLVKAMEVMKTKDSYGRDVVDPNYGIRIRLNEFGNSAVEISVKQHVLVPERIAYCEKAREVIYNALNEAGITIPFPQCDVHMIQDNEK